jgi:hypothetical protein
MRNRNPISTISPTIKKLLFRNILFICLPLLVVILSSCFGPPWYQSYGIKTMQDLADVTAIPKLTKALGDKDEDTRIEAARALGAIGHSARDAATELAKLQEDENPVVRVTAIEALIAIGVDRQEIAAGLVAVILSNNPHGRRIGILAHRRLGYVDEDTLEALRTVAEGDPHMKLRPLAAEVLREIAIRRVKMKRPISTPFDQRKDEGLSVQQTALLPDIQCETKNNDLAIIIGIEKYQHLEQRSDYSRNDANLIRATLRSLCFQDRNMAFLVDEQATLSSLRKTIEAWLPNNASPDRRLLLYFSGHGAPDPKGSGYLLPYDGDPNYIQLTGYPLQTLYEKIGQVAARDKIVILDSCFSGAGGRSVLPASARPVFVKIKEPTFKASNMVILTSSGMDQISTGFPAKHQGLFTYYLAEALSRNLFKVSEVFAFLKPAVENEAKRMNIEQSPTLFPPELPGLENLSFFPGQ